MNLALLGPGLLGGSIALAARARGLHRVALWARRPEAAAAVETAGMADFASTDLEAVLEQAEFVVFCVPIGAMPQLAERIAPVLSSKAVVTDVGSVKGPVCAQLSAIFSRGARFVGSHPMAGSDRHGLDAARADLFEGETALVTPHAEADPGALASVVKFWEELGCRVRQLSPADHDEIVAWISHLPHLLAATLVDTVAAENAPALEYCGPGFRDTTRVAGGLPEMWAEIFASNSVPVRRAAEALIEKLRGMLTLLDHDRSMIDFLTQAKTQRDLLRRPSQTHV